MGELEAGARQWEESCDPGQVTQTLASSLHGPSLELKPVRPNRMTETGPVAWVKPNRKRAERTAARAGWPCPESAIS